MKSHQSLDDPARHHELVERIKRKTILRDFYSRTYGRFAECRRRAPAGGACVELGSGGGFLKESHGEFFVSDILPYPGMDVVFDGTRMPFADSSVSLIVLLNTFHHIPDVVQFLREAERCLLPGGCVFMTDQHPGYVGSVVFRYLHHEPYDPNAKEWRFLTSGPLSGANGALAWIVFCRDRKRFAEMFPRLKLIRYTPHTPLQYFLSGGLKTWSAWPAALVGLLRSFDRALLRLSSEWGSFVDIEIEKTQLDL